MGDLPRPGIEPVSPALAGGFLTPVPPGKSQDYGKLKCMLLSDRSQSEKATYFMIPTTYMTFWKKAKLWRW